MRTPIPPSARQLRAVMDGADFDVVHVQTPYSPFLAGRLIRMAPRSTRVVTTFHIAPYSHLVRVANRLLALITRRSANRVDTWLAVSEVAAAFARDVYGKTCQVVPNPVDTTAASQFRESARPADRAPTVLFLGRLVERKGPDLLLNAIADAEAQHTLPPHTRVVMVGDGPLRPQLEAQAARLKATVTFMGRVEEEEKYRLLAQADVAVFPATGGESFGIVLTEAMAAGARVVIAGDNPGYRSTLAGSHGQLVDPRDARALGGAIVRALSDTQFAAACTAYQDSRVRDFDVTHVVRQLERVYRGLPAA